MYFFFIIVMATNFSVVENVSHATANQAMLAEELRKTIKYSHSSHGYLLADLWLSASSVRLSVSLLQEVGCLAVELSAPCYTVLFLGDGSTQLSGTAWQEWTADGLRVDCGWTA
jgi:hypothetical protein